MPEVLLADEKVTLINGDCLEAMKAMPDKSVDAIVTDPPYGLALPVLDDWDRNVPDELIWREALRVAKPGAYLLAFSATRTMHKLATHIETSGWDIRDCLVWMYAQGFPKGVDVSKAIDADLGAERETVGHHKMGAPATRLQWACTGEGEPVPPKPIQPYPASEEAAKWDGWNTTLKPCWEPVIAARRPITGTLLSNLREHGVGALNIGASRLMSFGDSAGRWPPNILHDGSDAVIDQMAGGERAFFQAKTTAQDLQLRTQHPTIKPLDLLSWLVRLVTPPGGLVLDPFCGSGTTLLAALRGGWRAIGIEREAKYCSLALDRLQAPPVNAGGKVDHQGQLGLFASQRTARSTGEAVK